MYWERRFGPEAMQKLYAIERGVAAQVSEGIKELAKKENPEKEAEPIEELDDEKLDNPAYWVEIHAHFIKFELWKDDNDRQIIKILDID